MDDFYKAFEDKYRGSRQEIKSRLSIYLPFVKPVLDEYPNEGAFDIGCGRGEWLELLTENGHAAKGMDVDQGMLDKCIELGLNAELKDAVKSLKAMNDSSLAVVTAFHVVEHIPFERLKDLVKHAYRVLVPGGLLIMETPNSENISVGTTSFYLDPTHQNPIPKELLSFVYEYYGFQHIKLLRLQESSEILKNEQLMLYSVLDGVSPDYAVVAQKGGEDKLFIELAPHFAKDYGISLRQLSGAYQSQMDIRQHSLRESFLKLEARIEKTEQEIQLILNSRSWRITAPLRYISAKVEWAKTGAVAWLTFKPGSRPRRISRAVLLAMSRWAIRHPFIKAKVFEVLKYTPWLKARLKRIYQTSFQAHSEMNSLPLPRRLDQLSPKAQIVYKNLRSAIKNTQQDNK